MTQTDGIIKIDDRKLEACGNVYRMLCGNNYVLMLDQKTPLPFEQFLVRISKINFIEYRVRDEKTTRVSAQQKLDL